MEHNLPTEPTQLLGREGELAAALECLHQTSVRLLTLLGPGGVGKTRLAVAIAESALRSFPDGGWFVDLVPLTDPDQVVPQIASALDLHDTGDQSLLDRLKGALVGRSALLVLDNFEHVVAAASSLVELLRDCPRLKLLVTSRVPLRVRWEQQFPVAPLAVPDLRRLPDWAKLADYASVRLFVERARLVQPSFRLTERNAATIAAICDAVDGLPLAIELAAARVKSLSINAIGDWISPSSPRRPLQLLAASYSDQPARHLSLRATIDWSYRLLSAEEQALFRQLCVFTGDFSLEAAELLTENEGWVEGTPSGSRRLQIFDLIASLVDKSLLLRKPEAEGREDREARYLMLQTIREFGLEQLLGLGELHAAQRHHAFLFTTLAEGAESEQNGPAQTIWFNRLSREWDNLRAALTWCLDNDPETGLRLAGSLERFWEVRDESGEGRQWLEAMLARATNARPEVLAKALSAAGTMAWRRADYRRAMEWHRQSFELYHSCGDRRGCALALNHLGVQHINLGDPQAAAASYEECVKIAREIDDAEVETFGLVNLGILALNHHELPRARAVLEEALALARRLESERILVYVLHNLGEVMLGLGETGAALGLQRECVRRCYDFDHKSELAYSLEELAGVHQKQGLLHKATRLFGAADALRELLKVPPNPVYRRQFYDPTLQALRDALGAKAFAVAWSAGRSSPIEEAVADALSEGESGTPINGEPPVVSDTHPLSRREREVAALIAQGMSNREIAEALVITEGTAANHVAHIMNKLGYRSRAQIASWAVMRGLVDAALG